MTENNMFGRPYPLEVGQVVASCNDFGEVMREAGLDFTVVKEPVYDAKGNKIHGYRQIKREDMADPFAIVSDGYKVVQNEKALAFARELHERNYIDFDRAGVIDHGAKVWISATLRDRKVIGTGVNEMMTNLIFITGHDASMGVKISFTACRVFCLNMILGRHANLFNFTAKHTKNVDSRLKAIKAVMSRSMQAYDMLEEEMAEMLAITVTSGEFKKFVESFFPLDSEGEFSTRARNQMEVISDYYHKDPTIGTAWGAYNAVVQWVDHDRGYSRPDKRMYTNLFGEGARIKVKAFERAMEICQKTA